MVNKKFRAFIRGLCISLSMLTCAASVAPAALASETAPQAEAGVSVPGETLPVDDDGLAEGTVPDVATMDGESGAQDAGSGGAAGNTAESSAEESTGGSGTESGGTESGSGATEGSEAESETGSGTGSESESEPGSESGSEPGSEAGSESESETGKETESESESEPESEKEPVTDGIQFSQDIENPASTDKVTVKAKIGIQEDQEKAKDITVILDGNTNVSAFTSEKLEGARIRFTHSGGDQVMTMGSSTDLSGFSGITKIVITPAEPLKRGDIELSMALQAAKEDTASMEIKVNSGEDGEKAEASYAVALSFCVLGKPAVGHPGALVQFGNELTVKMDGISLKSNKGVTELAYSMALPTFMELKSVKAPAVNAGTVDAYVTLDGERKLIGENVGGTVIEVGKDAEKVEFVAHVADGAAESTDSGNVVLVNNKKANKTNYFGFQSYVSVTCADGSTVEKASTVVGATLAIYKYTEPEPVQEGDKPSSGTTPGGSTGSQGGSETPSTEPAPEEPQTEETEDPNAEKEEEAQRRKEEAAEALLKEEEEKKNSQKNLLLARLNAIKAGVSSNADTGSESSDTESDGAYGTSASATATATGTSSSAVRVKSAAAKELYAEMKLAAIDEAMVSSLKPEDKRLATDDAKELYEEMKIIAIGENMVKELQAADAEA